MTLRVYFNSSKPAGMRKNFPQPAETRLYIAAAFFQNAEVGFQAKRGGAARHAAPQGTQGGEREEEACRARRRNDNMVKPHGLLVLLG